MNLRNIEVLARTMFEAWGKHKNYSDKWNELSNNERSRWLFAALVADESSTVEQFQKKFRHLDLVDTAGEVAVTRPRRLTKRKMLERFELMREELHEFEEAMMTGDFAGQVDALIDLAYVVKGTANMMHLPWAELFFDVHRANMAKVPGVGKRGHKVDVLKPEGWEPPKTEEILKRAGFVADDGLEYDDTHHHNAVTTNKEHNE